MDDSEFIDYYEILNLEKNCTTEDVKHAYRKYSQIFHPDRHRDDHLEYEAHQAFERIQRAYAVLSDPEKRKFYDEDTLIRETMIRNSALVPFVISDYSKVDVAAERQKLLNELVALSSWTICGKSSVSLDLKQIFNPIISDSSIIERVCASKLHKLDIKQRSFVTAACHQFELSPSNLVIFEHSILTNYPMSDGRFAVGLHHLFSPFTSSATWLYFSENRIIARGTAETTFFESLKVIVGYQTYLEAENYFEIPPTFGDIELKVIGKIFEPKDISLKLDYYVTSSLRSSLFVKPIEMTEIFNGVIPMGIKASYDITDKLTSQFSIKSFESGISIEGSAMFRVDELNSVKGGLKLCDDGVILKLSYTRQNQTIEFPIYLSDTISFMAVATAAVGGLLCVGLLDFGVVRQLLSWDRQKSEETKTASKNTAMIKNKKNAMADIQLMKPRYDALLKEEIDTNGLVITSAIMGELEVFSSQDDPILEKIDVKIALQILVKNSRLVVKAGSKYHIPGFYKPDTENPVFIKITYLFKERTHQLICNVEEAIVLPKQCN